MLSSVTVAVRPSVPPRCLTPPTTRCSARCPARTTKSGSAASSLPRTKSSSGPRTVAVTSTSCPPGMTAGQGKRRRDMPCHVCNACLRLCVVQLFARQRALPQRRGQNQGRLHPSAGLQHRQPLGQAGESGSDSTPVSLSSASTNSVFLAGNSSLLY